MAINFRPDPWTIRKNGREYKALGYEKRGIWNVPIADFLGGVPIQCTIYEITHGIIPAVRDHFISVESPNYVELVLLEEYGWKYDGCFISYVGQLTTNK